MKWDRDWHKEEATDWGGGQSGPGKEADSVKELQKVDMGLIRIFIPPIRSVYTNHKYSLGALFPLCSITKANRPQNEMEAMQPTSDAILADSK